MKYAIALRLSPSPRRDVRDRYIYTYYIHAEPRDCESLSEKHTRHIIIS